MAAPVGNQYWKLRETHGRDLEYPTPEELLSECIIYFEWCDQNPWHKNEQLKTPIVTSVDKDTGAKEYTTIAQIPTARPYTVTGLCVHLGIRFITWKEYCKREDYTNVTSRVEEIIETQQFEGATVGVFNANIIARKQGLAEKAEHTGKDGGPIETKFDITLNLNK